MLDISSFPHWLKPLLKEKFFNPCLLHETSKKNEKNIFCLDCCCSMCPQCISPHRSHPLLQIRRYVYHDVIRVNDLEKLIDCSLVQSYITNSAKVVFLKQRPQSRPLRGSGNMCSTCERSLQDPYIFCSLACKVQCLLKKKKKKKKRLPSKYYYQFLPITKESKRRSFCWETEDIVFGTSSKKRAWCRNLSCMGKTEFMKKKRSSVFGPFRPACSPEVSVQLNRRKGIPQRSPFY